MPLPYPAITKIPNTEPAAIPSLWNDTYVQIDANFTSVASRLDAIETTMVVNLGDLDITVTADKVNFLSGVTSDVQAQINGKFNAPAGTTAQYVRGDGSIAIFPTTWAWASISGKPTTFAASGMTLAAGDVPVLNQNTTGSAATLTTPRTLTIGSSGKAFNGSVNVAWTLAEIGAAATAHTHAIADVTGLQTALDGKSGSAHNHALDSLSNVTISNNALGSLLSWNGTAWVNSTLAAAGIAAAVHTHVIADVTGLQGALDGKLATTGTAAAATKLVTARILTLGATARSFDGTSNLTWTLADLGAAATSHTHVVSDVTGLQAALDGKASISHNHTLDSLSNVTITNNSIGSLMRWNGTAWVNSTLAAAGIAAASHTHVVADVTGLQGALDSKANLAGATFTGNVFAPVFAQSSSRRYKRDIVSIDASDALGLLNDVAFRQYRMRADGSLAFGVIAEELADGPLEFVVQRTGSGEPEAVNYQPLFILACAALQDMSRRVAALESKG